MLILALMLFIATLSTSVVVLTEYESGESDVKAAVACMVMLVSFVGIGSVTFKIFMVFFTRKIVTVVNVKTVDRSLEFSAFKNIQDIDFESDNKLTPL